jgi:hypothetical protein
MYKSLYEYFGRPVGGELGKQVYNASKRARVKVQAREIANPKYRGKVMAYPVSWLDTYFMRNVDLYSTSKVIMSKYDTSPCGEISLSTTTENKKQTLNFY